MVRDERLGLVCQDLVGTSHKKALRAKASLFSFNFAGNRKDSEGLGLAKKKVKVVAERKDVRRRDSPKKKEKATVAVRKKIRVRRISSSDDEDECENFTPPRSSSSSSASGSSRKKQKPVVELNKEAVIILNRCNKIVPLKGKSKPPPLPPSDDEANFGDLLLDVEEPMTEAIIENRAEDNGDDNEEEQGCTLKEKKRRSWLCLLQLHLQHLLWQSRKPC